MKKVLLQSLAVALVAMSFINESRGYRITTTSTCMMPLAKAVINDPGCDDKILNVSINVSFCNSTLGSFATCQPIVPGPPQTFSTSCTFTSLYTISPGPPQTKITAPAQVTMKFTYDHTTGNTDYYQTEMLQMNISGGNLPSGVMVRESPTLQSTGDCHIEGNGGYFLVSCFFDVNTEVSIDGGATWTAGTGGPRHYELQDIVHITSYNLSLNVNSQSFTGSMITTHQDTGQWTAITSDITYNSTPPVNLLGIGGDKTYACISFSIPVGSNPVPKNINTVSGGHFTLMRTDSIFDSNNVLVGRFVANGNVDEITPDSSASSVNIQGNYNGPSNLTSISGYQMLLHQNGPGSITGKCVRLINRSSGPPLTVKIQMDYTYNTADQLPGDEYAILNMGPANVNGNNLSFTASVHYVMASSIPTLSEWGLICLSVLAVGMGVVFVRRMV